MRQPPIRVLMLCAVLCGVAGPAPAQEEALKSGFDRSGWKVGHRANDAVQSIVEYVRPDESMDRWTELMTVHIIERPHIEATAEELVLNLQRSTFRRCPMTTWNVIHRDFLKETEEAGILYEYQLKDCPNDADQHEIARILYGREHIYRVSYVAKTAELAPQVREKWIKDLSASRIVRQ